jgi:Na+/melibiose symporter-like transporter
MSEVTTMKKSVPWCFFLALMCQMIGNFVAMGYAVYYMTERLLITVAVMGVVLLVARVIDMVMGVVVGLVVQKVQLKLGQYRAWLIYGPIACSIGTTMCFLNPAIPMIAKAIIVLLGNVIYGGAMSFIQLSENGCLAKIAGPSMEVRLKIAGKIVQGQNLGTIIASATILPMVMFFDSRGANGYLIVQIIVAIVGLAGQIPLFVVAKEYDPYDPNFATTNAGGAGFGALLGEVLKNGQLIILMLAELFRWATTFGLMSLGMYYFIYVVRNPNMLTVAMTIQSVLGFLSTLIMPTIAAKLGKKRAAITSGFLTTAFFAGLAAFNQINVLVVYIVAMGGFMVSQALVNSCGVNLFLDCGEYQYYKTGKDTRTFTMSMFGVSIKFGVIMSSFIITILLTLSGYDGETQTVADPARMAMLFGAIPCILNLIYSLLMCVYGITEEKSREYAQANFKKMQESGAAAS